MPEKDPCRFLLRMPQSLREQLRRAAEQNGRSLNLEIVARLEASVGQPDAAVRRQRRVTAAAAVALAVSAVLGLAGHERAGDAEGLPAGPGLKFALTVDALESPSGP